MRDATELFFEYEARDGGDPGRLKKQIVTTNDTNFWSQDATAGRELSPLARNVRRRIENLERDLGRIQSGWFYVGGKHDVPSNACYVAHSGNCYVWVEPDGREALSEFTLIVLKLSTLVKETQTLISPGNVKFSPGDRGG